MKKLFIFIFCALVLSFKPVWAEEITSFSVRADIQKNGKVIIKETIVYDFGTEEKHGIYRNIPLIKTNKENKKLRMDLKLNSVTDETGKSYKFTKTQGDELYLKIGDANKLITGSHVYILTYEVGGALTYFSDHDELYWNVNGNQWQIPINNVDFEVRVPFDLEKNEIKTGCYLGESGSVDQSCIVDPNKERILFTSPRQLNNYEGMTVVIGFPKNLVAVLEPKEIVSFWTTVLGKIISSFITIVIILLVIFWYIVYPLKIIYSWFKSGRDPKPTIGTVSAWYGPPKTKNDRSLTPAEVGTLIDESADMRDITATVVDLARRGYLKMEERKKNDWYLIKQNSSDELLSFEKELFNGIFSDGKNVRLKDTQLFSAVQKTKDKIYENMVLEKFFPKNPNSIRIFYIVITIIALFTFNFPLALIAMTFGRAMPVKTQLGVDALAVVRSLKNFLTSQERQLQFQAKEKMLFEKLLPFAIAFGVEKIWAQRFKNLNIKPPKWYSSYNQGTFNSVVLANSLHSSFNSMSSSFSPTTSSSGFSSGFSGGGFSGGGGGGGGGGSW